MLPFHLGFYYGILIHSLEFPSFPSRKVFGNCAQIKDLSSDDPHDRSTDYHSGAFIDEPIVFYRFNCHIKALLELG
jgi:hypothetical protein